MFYEVLPFRVPPVMPSPKSAAATPVTFEVPVALIGKMEQVRSRRGLRSLSDVVRVALDQFDYGAHTSPRAERRQLSVRLPDGVKRTLQRQARLHRTSAGELLRSAIDRLPVGAAKSKR